MRTARLLNVGALVAGILVGLVLLPIGRRFGDRHEWHARELSEWCNYYRNVAVSDRMRASELTTHKASGDGAGLGEIDLDVSSLRRWFARCAVRPLSYPDAADPEDAKPLLSYLQTVIEAVPERDSSDPRQYVAPVRESESYDFL